MTNLIIYGYYYNGKSNRKIIRDLVSTNNFTEAQIKIDSIIAEHDNYIATRNIPNDGNNFTSVDNFSLHHAKIHLEFADKELTQKQATIDALNEE